MNFFEFRMFLTKAKFVKDSYGVSIFAQIKDIVRLKKYPNRLSREEYYNLKLYKKNKDEQSQFLGSALEGVINYIVASPFWFSTVKDKLSFYNILRNSSISTPSILAIYGINGSIGSIRSATTPEALRQLLLDLETPFFGKPSIADVGVGAIRVEDVNQEKKEFLLANGEKVQLNELVDKIIKLQYGNFLFQEVLHNARELELMVGSGLSTVRICMMKSYRDGPIVYRAFMKICIGDNYNDNWDYGTTGNALAYIDVETGTIGSVVSGIFPDVNFSEQHPLTGVQLKGKRIPFWDEVVSLCQKASYVFPGIHMMHWDVAITPDGPSLVEMNEDGSIFALQELGRNGFYTKQFRNFFSEFGHNLESKETQKLVDETAKIIERLYGMDNAFVGRGSLYKMKTSMK